MTTLDSKPQTGCRECHELLWHKVGCFFDVSKGSDIGTSPVLKSERAPLPICVKCGHAQDLNDYGYCQTLAPATHWEPCRCKCEFPAPVQSETPQSCPTCQPAQWLASVVWLHYHNRTDLDPIQQKHLELAIKAGAPFSKEAREESKQESTKS